MKRITELEGLRGILALWVFLSHIYTLAGYNSEILGPLKFLVRGEYAVDVFILISGFVIFYLLENKKESYNVYIIRRFFRIAPLYYVCLFISILMLDLSLEALKQLPWIHQHNNARIQIFNDSKDYFIYHLVTHLSLMQGIIPSSYLPNSSYAFLGQAWSLSLEWQFYLVAPICLYLLKKNYTFSILVIAAIFVIHFSLRGDSAFLPTKIPFFFIGGLSYYLMKNIRELRGVVENNPVFTPVSAITVFFISDSIPLVLWGVVISTLLCNEFTDMNKTFKLERYISSFLNSDVMQYLGKISYSIYLSHMFILYLTVYLLNQSGFKPIQFAYLIILFIVDLPVIILFSSILHFAVEKPFIRIGSDIINSFNNKELTIKENIS